MCARIALRSSSVIVGGFWLAWLVVAGEPQTPLQSLAGPAPHQSSRAGEPAAAADITPVAIFFDDFNAPAIDPAKWRRPQDRRVSIGEWMGDAALQIRTAQRGTGKVAELRSMPIDAAADGQILVRVSASGTGGAAAALEVWIAPETGRPQLLGAITGIAVTNAMREFQWPSDLRQAGCTLILRAIDGDWAVTQIGVVREDPRAPVTRLTVDSAPPSGAGLVVLPESALTRVSSTMPAELTLPTGPLVRLIADATTAGYVFDRWMIDGVVQPTGMREIAVAAGPQTTALAEYRPVALEGWVTIDIGVSPPGAATIFAGIPEAERMELIESRQRLDYLPGETLSAIAPRRTEHFVFSHWQMSGFGQVARSTQLTLAVLGPMSISAHFVRIGDMNGDDSVDARDVDPFVVALSCPADFERLYPGIAATTRGDTNGDGQFDERDIADFVERVLGEGAAPP